MNKVLAQLNNNLPNMNEITDEGALSAWFSACSGSWAYITPVFATPKRATFRSLVNMRLYTFYFDNDGIVRMEETPKDERQPSFSS